MSEWKKYKLGDLGILARGKSKHRPRDASFLYGGKYPFIQTGDIKAANHRIHKHFQTYSEDGLKQSKLWPEGTICITIAANIADTAILSYPACFPDSVLGFVADNNKCDIDFMEYLLQHTKRTIQSHAIGSVQDNINLGTFERIELNVPNLHTQTQIASILSALDEKIELNLQMNQTLEAMAQAIFKEWFVNFNFPGFDGELVDGLPKGWRMGKVKDIYKTTSGGTPSRTKEEYYENGTINWVKSKELNGNFIFDTEEKITEEALKNSSTKLIPRHSILLAMYGATVGEYAITSKETTCNQAICAVIANEEFPFTYFFEYFKINRNEIIGRASGSAQQNISQALIQQLDILIPPIEVVKKYHSVVEGIFIKMENNLLQIQSLTQIRDSLLPKLMTGKIEIKE